MITTRFLSEEERKALLRFAISVGDKMSTLIYAHVAIGNEGQLTSIYNNYIATFCAKLKELQKKKQEFLSVQNDEERSKSDCIKDLDNEIFMYENRIRESREGLENLKNKKPLPQKYIDFCKSFDFGESGKHYEIKLTQDTKEFFAKEGVVGDYGNLALGEEPRIAMKKYDNIIFEDIDVYCNGKQITSSVTHEDCFEVEFDGALEEKFLNFENVRDRNEGILTTLRRSRCPQDLTGKRMKVNLTDDKLLLKVEDGRKFTFDFSGCKSVKYFDKIKDKRNVDFINGNEYILEEMFLWHDLQGNFGKDIDYYHSETGLTFKTDSEEYCCIEILADKIFVDEE